jgi:phosphopantothenate--cysteine ligase
MKILITSGGTKIPIDKVRDITNMSTGTFGTKIAEAILRRGHEVAFLYAKGSKNPMQFTYKYSAKDVLIPNFDVWFEVRKLFAQRYTDLEYTTFDDYANKLHTFIKEQNPDVIVLAAAVSDYGVVPFDGKVRTKDAMSINFHPLPKVISKIKDWAPTAKLVGFKMLVDSDQQTLSTEAWKSCKENGCNMVVANDLSDIRSGKHKIMLVNPRGDILKFDAAPDDPDYLAGVVAYHILNSL